MSTSSKNIHASHKIVDFYETHLKKFGNTSQGVGWKNNEAQQIRFAQLSKLIQRPTDFSINDLGCGTGGYYSYLIQEHYQPGQYSGYDILDDMIASAEEELLPNSKVTLTKITSASDMSVSDYSVASGIFNVKYDANESDWLSHILSTLKCMDERSELGFAFNLLTKYSDKEFMQSYLYYADPLFLFDYCKQNFSKNVALLHDYNQYDFTIIVRKN